ncbi:glutathione S-transferase family protein [Stutzerimonas nosocomialis]|uniref:glutathione S-transferase family protein n=1 Tax=Stutzerimonas nosocomialis TaxID=1056496 RepID=UPI0011099A3A|nr:glutathione S-transferase N-terminal domain-containing protein [Stutzerimonas nosocomialis]TLX56250.1 glutathione S-transferase family protein [Stutzerimonas nosocomialis]TLX58680.1 glutathione S-transferase family protein [Stutzerimonas nosocomialis]
MLLYQFRKGTNPRRVIIYLAEKGIDVPRYELDYVNGEHRSASYLKINPAGRAPTLVTDSGLAITESAAIVEYLEELYPANPMIGSDPLSRARVRSLERLGNDLIARGQLWLWNRTDAFPAKEPAPSPETADRTHRYVTELLDVLEKEIGENAFLAGAEPTIADFTTFTIFQTARERFDLPFGNFHPRLNAWFDRFRARPSADY